MSHEIARMFHVFPKVCETPYVRNAVGGLENTPRNSTQSKTMWSKHTFPTLRRFRQGTQNFPVVKTMGRLEHRWLKRAGAAGAGGHKSTCPPKITTSTNTLDIAK
ncbi:hypothetical protein Zmor_014542 [Zophobas morio]|uniref:Uncharacterized protein n=1 Tax=Zophobas morio TaxID=2755281 RepID=A0AA38IFA8_9CUCU|nr:hypothetical protein Zmor_014542 [Zophobas morio]